MGDNPIQETCGKFYVTVVGCNHEREIEEEECGISLEGMNKYDPKLAELFEVAGMTGSDTILSRDDVLKKLLADDLASLPADQQTATQNRAQAFLENARSVIKSLPAPLPQEPVMYFDGGCRK